MRKWFSGAELGPGADESPSTDGLAVQSSVVRSGNYAYEVSGLTSGGRKQLSGKITSSASNGQFWSRAYLYISTLPTAENTIIAVSSGDNMTSSVTVPVWITLGSDAKLRLYDEAGLIGQSDSLQTGQWYRVELYFNKTANTGDHEAELRIDGTTVASASNRTFSAGLRSVCFGGNLKAETQTTGVWYFDDIAINNSTGTVDNSWPGEGSIVFLRPNGPGSNSGWNIGAGTGQLYEQVDETPPDDATTYITCTGSMTNAIADFTFAVPNILQDKLIKSIWHGMRHRAQATSGVIALYSRLTIGGQLNEESIGNPSVTAWHNNTQTSAITYNYDHYLTTVPNSTQQITYNHLLTMEAGVRTGTTAATNGIDVTAIWVAVEYTDMPPDTIPPVITNVQASNITGSSAVITWTTDELATSRVFYDTVSHPASTDGTDYAFSSPQDDTADNTSHSVSLTSLNPGTTYYYRVRSRDAAGNMALSDEYSFVTQTVDTTPPVITNVSSNTPGSTDVTITWNTDELATSRVFWNTTSAASQTITDANVSTYYPNASADDTAADQTNHSVTITGLTASTTYYYRVRSADASGNVAYSQEYSFTTAAAAPPGALVISSVDTHGTYNTIGVHVWFTGDDDANASAGPWTVTTAGATQGSTVMPVSALPISIPANTRLVFYSPSQQKAYPVVTTASASIGSTSLSVQALSAGLPSDAETMLSGLFFKKSGDNIWRVGLAPWRVQSSARGFLGAILECDPGSTYNIEVHINDGGQEIVTSATGSTPIDNISSIYDSNGVATLTPDYVVDAVNGNDNNAGTPSAPWQTLQKAITSAPANAKVMVKPGFYAAASSTRTTPIVLYAQYAAVDPQGQPINEGNRAVISPVITAPANTPNEPNAGVWQQVTVTGAISGQQWTLWKWTSTAGTSQLGWGRTKTMLPERIPNWKMDTSWSLGQCVDFVMTNNKYRYGVWKQSGTNDIYLVLPPFVRDANGNQITNPNQIWITTSAGSGISLNAVGTPANPSRISGFEIRCRTEGITLNQGCRYVVIDNNLFDNCQYGVRTKKSGSGNAQDIVIQENLFLDHNMRHAPGTNDPSLGYISWNAIKASMSDASGTLTQGRTFENCEGHAVQLYGGGQRVVIRRNVIDGPFNGFGSYLTDASGWLYLNNIDIYDNVVRNIADDVVEFEDHNCNIRLWRNRIEYVGVWTSVAPGNYGPVYQWRNQIWRVGAYEMPKGLNDNDPGVAAEGFKHDQQSVIPVIWFINNTFWTDQYQWIQPHSQAMVKFTGTAGGGAGRPLWRMYNNIIRSSLRTGSDVGGYADDYNLWTLTLDPATQTSPQAGHQHSGTVYQTYASYRNATGKGLHSNKLAGQEVLLTDTAKIDNLLQAPYTGDLTIKGNVVIVDAGYPIPNIADNYLGNAPTIGHMEVEQSGGQTDTTPPETSLVSMPPLITNQTSAAFEWTSNEAGTYQYRLDGGPWQNTGLTTVSFSGLTAGQHVFEVRAIDQAGNIDPTPASYTWTIDLTPPETTITGAPGGVTPNTTATITWTSNETGCTYEVRLDGGNWVNVGNATSRTYTGLAPGQHTFQVRAIDPAGNVDPTPASATWTVANTGVHGRFMLSTQTVDYWLLTQLEVD